jgi:hypothetical protein
MPIIHRSHTLYSADPQRYTMPDSIAPSGRWNRSLTKTVLRIRTARRVLTKSPFLINFFIMMRLSIGAPSLGSCCTQASAKVLADGRIRRPQPQGTMYLWSGADSRHLICSSAFDFYISPFVQETTRMAFNLGQSDCARPPAKFKQELVDHIKMNNLLRV